MSKMIEIDGIRFWENKVTGETAEEVYTRHTKQIDICQTKTVEERLLEAEKENTQLWETVEFLLKNTGFIPGETVDSL